MEKQDFNYYAKSILTVLGNAYPFSKKIGFDDIHKDGTATNEQINLHNSVIEFLISEGLLRLLPVDFNVLSYYQLTPNGFSLFCKNA
ncbi:hypothetical protein [Pseudoalteromonas denitrificans]|uniref:Uncharacterized protein n=1 Tax=Pseudoalteromonas denitrificans DSM 6059 TaxID=1123010 RepID=A0A1I1G729_9GAMM|nr:hypothetical protein [Pseudoalteromonas denitrificans]SFC07142.1 hypothetical protein SAMN02745724_00833 [Pseudoalteromonas denitrificans DSM 6059]